MMEQLFNIDLEKISTASKKELEERKKNLNIFLESGLPNKKDENWKFTDLNAIIKKNFKNIVNNQESTFNKRIEIVKDFEHNQIVLVNGSYKSSDFKFEDKQKVQINSIKSQKISTEYSRNNLYRLNKALTVGGFNLEIQKNYKCRNPIIIYNYFTSNLDNKIINNSNKIKLHQNSECTLIEYNIDEGCKFLKNTFELVEIENGSILKNIILQKTKSNGYFYKSISGFQDLKLASRVSSLPWSRSDKATSFSSAP